MNVERGDLWSLGCTIYQLAFGQRAFDGASEYLIFQKIKQVQVSEEEGTLGVFIPSGCSEELRSFLLSLLVRSKRRRLELTTHQHPDPSLRATVKQAKENSLFQGIDWEASARKELHYSLEHSASLFEFPPSEEDSESETAAEEDD